MHCRRTDFCTLSQPSYRSTALSRTLRDTHDIGEEDSTDTDHNRPYGRPADVRPPTAPFFIPSTPSPRGFSRVPVLSARYYTASCQICCAWGQVNVQTGWLGGTPREVSRRYVEESAGVSREFGCDATEWDALSLLPTSAPLTRLPQWHSDHGELFIRRM
jgi:hypothetical protein